MKLEMVVCERHSTYIAAGVSHIGVAGVGGRNADACIIGLWLHTYSD